MDFEDAFGPVTKHDLALIETHDKKNPPQKKYKVYGTPKLFQPPLPFTFASGKPSKDFKKSHQKLKRQMAYHRKKKANLLDSKPKKRPKMSTGVKRLDEFLAKNFPDGFKKKNNQSI